MVGILPARQFLVSAPGYGPHRYRPWYWFVGTRHASQRDPLSIPFDDGFPYSLHTRQILGAAERTMLPPVLDDGRSP